MLKGIAAWTPLVLAITLLAVASNSFAARLYKWTDSEGNVQYTESPPPKGEYKELAPPRAPSTPPPEAESAAETPATTAPAVPKDKAAELEAQRKKLDADIARHNCEAARKNLETYTATRRIMNEKGEVEILDDDVRAARIKESNDTIKKYCK